MNEKLALNLLSNIMQWDDKESSEEFAWLRLMARIKYDEYRDFQAGMRFIESFAAWLQQFQEHEERIIAYNYIKNNLIYISSAEMQTLVEEFYPNTVLPHLYEKVAKELGLEKYMIFNNDVAAQKFISLNKSILYMGLSDGARIDLIRRSCIGKISNEQVVLATQVDKSKWDDLLLNLRDATQNNNSLFQTVYLIDDFTATGTSLLRFDSISSKWKGKLVRFFESLEGKQPFEENFEIYIHHYIVTESVLKLVHDRYSQACDIFIKNGWIKNKDQIKFTFCFKLNNNIAINNSNCNCDFIKLTEKYYNNNIETRHTKIGGVDKINLGYGACGLPLILEHNTPNNSIALLWAEADGGQGKFEMRPLFRRRQRHT